jgi:hypothetical protein
MTILERLVVTVPVDPEWADLIAVASGDNETGPTCQVWGRKGASHYKDGQFAKK